MAKFKPYGTTIYLTFHRRTQKSKSSSSKRNIYREREKKITYIKIEDENQNIIVIDNDAIHYIHLLCLRLRAKYLFCGFYLVIFIYRLWTIFLLLFSDFSSISVFVYVFVLPQFYFTFVFLCIRCDVYLLVPFALICYKLSGCCQGQFHIHIVSEFIVFAIGSPLFVISLSFFGLFIVHCDGNVHTHSYWIECAATTNLLFLSLLLFPLEFVYFIFGCDFYLRVEQQEKKNDRKLFVQIQQSSNPFFSNFIIHIWLAFQLNKYFWRFQLKKSLQFFFFILFGYYTLSFVFIVSAHLFSRFIYYCGKYFFFSIWFTLLLLLLLLSTRWPCEMDRIISKQVAILSLTFLFAHLFLCRFFSM